MHFDNVVNTGNVTSYKNVGGIAGVSSGTVATANTITNAVNYGLLKAITLPNTCGQIAGDLTQGILTNCY